MEETGKHEISEIENPITKAYHWTSAENAEQIKQEGLMPMTMFAGNDYMTYSMLGSPYPKEWKKYHNSFDSLIERYGENPVVVSFDVFKKDNPWVLDDLGLMDSILSKLGKNTRGLPNHVKFKNMVPLDQYKGNFRLPELVFFNTIPPERLTFIDRHTALQESK